MKKTLIIYGSTTGNTEDMAGTVSGAIETCGLEVTVTDVSDASAKDLAGAYDLVLLGCPAYGDDTIELQEDFEEFYDEMDGLDLKGKLFGVFAPGDSSYDYFCGSVDKLEEKLTALGGELAGEGLKIDGDPGDAEDEIVEWAKAMAAAVPE